MKQSSNLPIGVENRRQPRALESMAGLPFVFALLLLGVVGLQTGYAQPQRGAGILKTPVGPDGTRPLAHVGDTITASIRVFKAGNIANTLTITSIVDVVQHGTGTVASTNLLTAPVTLSNIFPQIGSFVTRTHTYTVLASDPDILLDDAIGGGFDNHDEPGGTGVRQAFPLTFPAQIRVLRPCIRVTNVCLGLSNGLFRFSGSVSNCGNTPLMNVYVSNLVDGVFTTVLGPVTLTNRAVLAFSVTNDIAHPIGTVFATGMDELALSVSDSSTAVCPSASCLGDFVWEDRNANGLQDPGEPGIPNVMLRLQDCASSVFLRQTNTDSQGRYLFCDLSPGTYRVEITVPFGYSITRSNVGPNDCVDSDATLRISNTTWLTDCTTLLPGTNNLCTDIGLKPLGAIGDFVWDDLDRNGLQDLNEPGVANVQVRLLNCDGVGIATNLTDSAGRYFFDCLSASNYMVQFILPPGYEFTLPNFGSDIVDSDALPPNGFTGCFPLMLGETNRTIDAGLVRRVCLGDFVWEDRNGNGIQDVLTEPGVANVLLRLQDCNSGAFIRQTNTGPLGQYLFCDLLPGSYRVEITVPAGYSITLSNQGPNDCVDSDAVVRTGLTTWQTDCVTLAAGTNNLCTDIGLKPMGAIGDFVWEDRNGNGLQDTGEVGVANVVVQLLNCNNQLITSTNTDSAGGYLFTCLPASNYIVRFFPPAAFELTTPNVGLNDAIDSDALLLNGSTACFPLTLGETNRTIDAGLVRRICIGDFVWEDRNGNGLQDFGEPGIPNVMLRLQDCASGAILRQTNTGPQGLYLFCDLLPGNYRVEITVPAGYSITLSNRGPDDCVDSDATIQLNASTWLTDCIVLMAGTNDFCTDFGLKPLGAIGDFVWEDLNGNGLQNAGEPGVANVTVQLLNCNNQIIAFTNTDSGGRYLFTCLPASNYVVRFLMPAGLQFTLPNVGANDAVDSDADANGVTTCFNLGLGQTNLTIDAGLVRPVVPCPPYQLICPQNLIVECGSFGAPTNLFGLTNLFSPPSVVNGSNVVLVVVTNQVNTNATCPLRFSITRIWRATDACTNIMTCSQTITVVDTTPPNITCGDDRIIECNQPIFFTPPFAVDVCDGTNVIVRLLGTVTNAVSPRCPGLTNIIRTWSASDTCGNSNVCSQTITIVDTTPPNITCGDDQIVECNQPFAFTPPFAVDACEGTNVIIRILATVTNAFSPRCPGLTNIVRTWSASDSCGNSNICSQTITLIDTTPPNITCADNRIVECNQPFTFTPPFAVDACEGTNVTIRILSTVTNVAVPRCPNLTNIVRTWSASDSCGNSNICSQTITIIDTTPPNLACELNKEVECGSDWAFDIPTAVDGCDANNVVIEVVSTVTNVAVPRCPRLLSVTRTWRATDTCGNASFCNQTVTVLDTTPPNITCERNKDVECGNDWAFDIPTAVDACDLNNVLVEVVSTVTNIAAPRCPKLLSVTRTWRATDTCGNASFCNQTVTIQDTTPPNLVCAPDRIVECDQPYFFTAPTAVDACDGTNIFISIISTTTNAASPRCPNLLTVRRTWRATDTCSNQTFCSQTITVVDTTPPNITCADDQIVECNQPFAFTVPTAVDACDGTNVVVSIISTTTNAASPRCPNLFTVRRTWRATDTCSNQTFCSQTITVVDTTPPNITCADDQIVECNQPFAFTPPFALDACDGTNVTIQILSTTTNAANPRCPELFTVRRSWRAVDTCGNESRCTQTITIVDTTPPNITCGDNQIIECNQPFAFTPPFAIDACDGTNVTIRMLGTVTTAVSPRCPGLTNIVRTWSASDTCGNSNVCSQTITIIDTTPPNITCADNQIVECNQPYSFIPPFAVDACDGANVTIRILSTVTTAVSPRCPGLTNIVRTWSASDTCGNSNVCSQTITIIDTTPPNITCGDNQIVECNQPWNFTPPFAVDACEGTNVVIRILSTTTNIANPRCPNLLSAVRLWSASDSCGNSNICSQTITVVDTLPPEIVCRRDRIVECGIPWNFDPPSASDACDGLITNFVIVGLDITNRSNPACTNSYSVTRTWRATDSCTNSATCSQTVLVVDSTPPVFNCPANRVVECGLPVNFITPMASDLCGGTNVTVVTNSTVTNLVTCGIAVTRTWTATDRCGNSASCSQTIVVIDTLPPVLTGVPGDLTVRCRSEIPPFGPVGAYDLCDTNVAVTVMRVTNGICPTIIRTTWTATDDCSNSVSQTQFITVQPLPPVVTSTPADVFACAGSNATFCVNANNACPLTYQWLFNGAILPGRTNSCLTVSNVTTANIGRYCVVVANECYSVTNCANLSLRSSVGDYVWEDLNFNGCQDTNEVGVSNVIVHLIDCTGTSPIRTTMTDALGRYGFDCVEPGSYRVRFFLPSSAWMFTVPVNPACGTALDSDPAMDTGITSCFNITAGMGDVTRDAGLFRKAAIGDFVWHDRNSNGVQNAGEPGVPNVRVDLMECFGAMSTIRTTNTAADGSYLFTDLAPGSYKVTFSPPPGHRFTLRDQGADNLDSDADVVTGMTICYTLVSGQTNRTVDAGVVPNDPCIDVTEWVACLLPGDQCGPFAETAQGYSSGTNYPAFCYAVTVSNCGPVTLTNVMIMDIRLGNLTTEFFPNKLTPFPPGATLTRYWKLAVDHDATNVVTASGNSTGDGRPVSDTDSVITYVDPASVTCRAVAYSPDDTDGSFTDGHVTLPSDGLPHPVTFIVEVCNTMGQADLANVRLTTPGLSLLPGCLDPAPFNLARGACRTQILCTVNLTCDDVPLTLASSVIAHIDTSGGQCAYDMRGSNILVQSSAPCSMQVECEAPGACRVTGGGRQETSYPSVRYVTHGGQVGAPVGSAGFDPGTFEREGSECIHGNWEHVRHDKGGNRGNFHAKIFDSLMCACLGCPENPGSGVVIGELCNPDDRICGPEPRRSPANKICFSGIGDYTMTSGSRTPRAVLFRVDIEDRSEPGNSHAGGSTPPHDRHRIRMWVLTTAEVARLNNPNDRLLDMRRAIACTPGTTSLQDGAIGSNGLSVPLGTGVFGIRPPDVDDGGEMDHGNHQIHPMIKDCP